MIIKNSGHVVFTGQVVEPTVVMFSTEYKIDTYFIVLYYTW